MYWTDGKRNGKKLAVEFFYSDWNTLSFCVYKIIMLTLKKEKVGIVKKKKLTERHNTDNDA